MKRLIYLLTFLLLLPVIGIGQNIWQSMNLHLGIGGVKTIQNPLKESGDFNPAIQFEFTYSRSIFGALGFKSLFGFGSSWLNTRASFVEDGSNVVLTQQPSSNLNTFIRSNYLMLGFGPQLRLYKSENEQAFLSIKYVPSYLVTNKVKYKVVDDTKLYGQDLNDFVQPFRHFIRADVSMHRNKGVSNTFNAYTFYGAIDLTGYASNGDFKMAYIGFLLGI